MKRVSRSLLALTISTSVLVGCGKKSSEEHLSLAQAALANADYATAAIELKNAVQQTPQDANVRFLLGKTYFQLKQYKAAEKELERALEFNHPAGEVVPMLSQVYRKLGENKQLFKLTAKASGLKTKELAQVKFYQLQAYVEQGNEPKANSLIDEMKKMPIANEFTQLALAYDLILKNELDAALLQLEQLLSEYPNQLDAMKMQAQLHLQSGQSELAIETLKTYTSQNPEDHETKYLYARLLADFDLFAQAEPVLDELMALYQAQPLLLQLKAAARLSVQDYKQAFQFASEAVNLNLEDNTARLIAGISAYFTQDYKSSETHLALLASVLPAEHPALRMLAESQLRLGMSLEATETTNRFDAISEQDASLFSTVGQALVREGEILKAKQLLSKQPEELTTALALANKANLKLSLNDVSGIVDLEQALEKSQANGELAKTNNMEFTLALAYLSSGQLDKAKQLAAKWKSSSNVELQLKGLALNSKLLLNEGALEASKAELTRAAQLAPENPSIQLELIRNFASEQSTEQTLASLQQLLKQYPTHLPTVLTHYLTSKSANLPVLMTEYLTKLVATNSNQRPLKVALGKMWLMEGQVDKAIEVLESAKVPQPEVFWRSLASAYVQAEQFDKATALYQDWFEQQPNNTDAINGMAKVYDSQGRFDLGLVLTQRYLTELGGDNLEITLLDLHFQARARNIDKLRAGLDTLSDDVKAQPFVQGLEGQYQFLTKSFATAQPLLEAAYEANPNPLNANLVLATIFQNKGEQTALVFLKKHVEKHPNDQANVMRYAQLMTGKDNKTAQKYYQQVLNLNSRNFIALNNLANLYMMGDDFEKAHEYAERALALKPNEGQVLDTIGSIELKKGNYSEALNYLEKAISQLKDKVPEAVALNYVEALYANQQRKLAERKVEQFSLNSEIAKNRLAEINRKYQN